MPVEGTAISIPFGVSARAAFPSTDAYEDELDASSNIALVADAGLSFTFGSCRFWAGVYAERLASDLGGAFSTIGDRRSIGVLAGLSFGL